MTRWYRPDQMFDGADICANMAIAVENDQIVHAVPGAQAPASTIPLRGLVTPGFVDLQVNGGGGVLFNAQPDAAGIAKIAAAHKTFGTTAIMPTVITDAPSVMERAADAAIAAKDAAYFAGIHFEGPHIATTRRGTHAADHIRPLDAQTMHIVTDLRQHGIPVMITLAPEAASPAQITALAKTGAVVSLGHSDATADMATAAYAAGACACTHLFNAMSQMQGRAPGMVGAALNSDAYIGMICDGHHVDDRMLALAIRARKDPDRMFLVSDAMPTVGGPDAFALYGQDIRLQEGKLVNADGNLAGAHLTMADALHRMTSVVGVPPAQALRMAVTVPAQLIGQGARAALVGQSINDVVILDQRLVYGGTLAAAIQNQLA